MSRKASYGGQVIIAQMSWGRLLLVQEDKWESGPHKERRQKVQTGPASREHHPSFFSVCVAGRKGLGRRNERGGRKRRVRGVETMVLECNKIATEGKWGKQALGGAQSAAGVGKREKREHVLGVRRLLSHKMCPCQAAQVGGPKRQ